MRRNPSPKLYGLLYIGERQPNPVNVRGEGDPLDIYVRCAELCAKSIDYQGLNFSLITNEKDRVQEIMARLGIESLQVEQEQFNLSVPTGIPFREAHFKLELFRKFGSGRYGKQLGLIDIDSVMVNPFEFPELSSGSLLAYDITDQILPEFGEPTVRLALERVGGAAIGECRWYGGECLIGHSDSFDRLATAVFEIWPRYLRWIGDLHHVGDEMPIACALARADLKVLDAGRLGLIGRWWTARTNFPQVPLTSISERSILHLPADKAYLAADAKHPFVPQEFVARYTRFARRKLAHRRLYNIAALLLNKERKYVAAI